MIKLTESKNYRIYGVYETAILSFKNKQKADISIGDFYGDVSCSIITSDEKICIMGGCGIIIYFLKEPFNPYKYHINPYKYHTSNEQWIELLRYPNNILWIDDFQLINDNEILVITDQFDNTVPNYVLELTNYTLTQINKN